MLDSGLLLGNPRIRFLAPDQVTVSLQLNLPFVNKEGGVILTDTPAKNIKQPLLSGGVRYIMGGVRHNVELKWGLYDPIYISSVMGLTVGLGSNNVPELTDLYTQIATYNNGCISISPCSNKELWYRVACTSDLTRETLYPVAFTNVDLTFEGLDCYSTSSSTTVIG